MKLPDAEFKLVGKSGRRYNFTAYTLEEEFEKGSCGIYVFTSYNYVTNTHSKFIYCGQYGDLSERFDNHHKIKCIKANEANCIGIMLVHNPEALNKYETDLLEGNSFICNEQHQN